ncbi:MAG TPA: hypothetical protein VFE11_01780 [Dongiaceae bacterium]|nr:hypothetical protein [Dongiaceae bacterium]
MALAACTSRGKDFTRPDPASLVLGQTTLAEATVRFGPPTSRTVRRSLNPASIQQNPGSAFPIATTAKVAGTIDSLSYSYIEITTPGLVVGPRHSHSKSLFLAFWDERLVMYSFSSSFSRDSVSIDENRIRAFVRGQTTRADVLQALGPPTGEAIYPFVEKEGTRLLIYQQVTSDSSGATPLTTETVTRRKSFRLLFDAADRLIDSTQQTSFMGN